MQKWTKCICHFEQHRTRHCRIGCTNENFSVVIIIVSILEDHIRIIIDQYVKQIKHIISASVQHKKIKVVISEINYDDASFKF